jgi:hypothetical protein
MSTDAISALIGISRRLALRFNPRQTNVERLNTAQLHLIPKLPLPPTTAPLRTDLPAIRDAIAATRHLLEMFRLQLEGDKAGRKLRRLTQRLLNIHHELDHLTSTEK